MGMKDNSFGRVGVLMGGPSSERDISLKSGKAVYKSLNQLGLDVIGIDIKTDQIKENIRLIKSSKINLAFLTLHGRFGEDGSIQGILEALKIPYTGSGVLASRLAIDKISSRKIFESSGLRVPRYRQEQKSSYNPDWKIESELVFPLVIKPATGGSSIGLSIVDNEEEVDESVSMAFSFD